MIEDDKMPSTCSTWADIYKAITCLKEWKTEPEGEEMRDSAVAAGSAQALPALCCCFEGPSTLASELSNSTSQVIFALLSDILFRIDVRKISTKSLDSYHQDKLRRIGIAVHLRTLIDSNATYDLRALVTEWNRKVGKAEVGNAESEYDSKHDNFLAEAFWMEKHIASNRQGHVLANEFHDGKYTAVTKFATVSNNHDKNPNPGSLNTLVVKLYARPAEMPAPKWGFVRTPASFAFFLDDQDDPFSPAFANVCTYLETLNIWRPNLIVEWDIKPSADNPVPELNGPSAGAAIALATGNILARYVKDHP